MLTLAAAPIVAVTAGTNSNGTPAGASAAASSPPRPKHQGRRPSTDRHACEPGVPDEQTSTRPATWNRRSSRAADGRNLGVRPRLGDEFGRDERIIENTSAVRIARRPRRVSDPPPPAPRRRARQATAHFFAGAGVAGTFLRLGQQRGRPGGVECPPLASATLRNTPSASTSRPRSARIPARKKPVSRSSGLAVAAAGSSFSVSPGDPPRRGRRQDRQCPASRLSWAPRSRRVRPPSPPALSGDWSAPARGRARRRRSPRDLQQFLEDRLAAAKSGAPQQHPTHRRGLAGLRVKAGGGVVKVLPSTVELAVVDKPGSEGAVRSARLPCATTPSPVTPRPSRYRPASIEIGHLNLGQSTAGSSRWAAWNSANASSGWPG